MKIKEDLPSCCKGCSKFILKVNDQVFFVGKTRSRVLSARCRFSMVCDKYKEEMKRRGNQDG